MNGAGILFLTADNRALFLLRGDKGDHAGEWCFPGGHMEDGETAEETAVREAKEEVGFDASNLVLHTRTVTAAPTEGSLVSPDASSVDFTTFLVRVDGSFPVTLNEEHTAFVWAPVGTPPQPLHAGCQVSLDRLTMDELGVARAMAAGQLTSPQRYDNMTLFDMRITGTGLAYRSSLDEFVWRDPSIYMNDEFLARCNGLAVIMEHPLKATLNSEEFADRIVGSILLPYLKPEEVWGIAKVYDDEAIKAMKENQLSTSPCVVFRNLVNSKMTLEDGSVLLIEGKPSLLDHIAICQQGVWDKGGSPAGIISDGEVTMAEEAKTEETKPDADFGEKLDKMLAAVDSMNARMDSIDEDRKADKARRDSEEEDKAKKADDDKNEEEKGEPKEVAADKKKDSEEETEAKKDAEEDEAEAKKADADAALRDHIGRLERKLADVTKILPRQLTDADYHALTEVQSRADSVFQAFGDSAPRPLNGEDLPSYRRRLAAGLKKHSKIWGDVNVFAVNDAVAFDNMENQIYADAMAAAMAPLDVAAGQLREMRKQDITGRVITEFVGEPLSWMNDFAGSRRRVVGIRNS